ncbi:MAG: UDP-galactopyranose mutase [Lachnospiraceae bacterium]|nr:UDP-galactopyranose mutase [Lachnospiraceae bacterium]
MYDIVVVGAGFSGSVLARKIAEEANQKVLVVERRSHVAGNAYDEYDENGILIQKYGPHFFATYQWWVLEYLMQFSEFYECPIKAVSYVNGRYIDRPYNFKTLQQLLGPENSQSLLEKIRALFPNRYRVPVSELLQCKDKQVSDYAKLLYDTVYAPYVAKQWGLTMDEIDPSVINRNEVVLGYDSWIVDWDFQYMPKNGYTAMIEKILDHPLIDVEMGTDALNFISFYEKQKKVKYKDRTMKALVFTGAIDELFESKLGDLPYRSREFTYQTYEGKNQLPCGVVTYPKEQEYIRQTEFRQFNPYKNNNGKTVVQSEYSLPYNRKAEKGREPYYPILNEKNIRLYHQYKSLGDNYSNLFLCGRLAEYRYYDMDKAIISAFHLFEEMQKKGIFDDKL